MFFFRFFRRQTIEIFVISEFVKIESSREILHISSSFFLFFDKFWSKMTSRSCSTNVYRSGIESTGVFFFSPCAFFFPRKVLLAKLFPEIHWYPFHDPRDLYSLQPFTKPVWLLCAVAVRLESRNHCPHKLYQHTKSKGSAQRTSPQGGAVSRSHRKRGDLAVWCNVYQTTSVLYMIPGKLMYVYYSW